MLHHNMQFMTGLTQCQMTGEHCFITLTAHFTSVQAKPKANVSANAAGGTYMVEFSMLHFKIM